jgi:hypothetical protein
MLLGLLNLSWEQLTVSVLHVLQSDGLSELARIQCWSLYLYTSILNPAIVVPLGTKSYIQKYSGDCSKRLRLLTVIPTHRTYRCRATSSTSSTYSSAETQLGSVHWSVKH